MKKFLGTTVAIAALAVLGACSTGVEEQTAPDAGTTVVPETETYVEPGTEAPEAMEEPSADDKTGEEMAPVEGTEGVMEEPSEDVPADATEEAPAEDGAAN
jgi:ABC-type glycerol-3-phosphate transport system substrate-binding protein